MKNLTSAFKKVNSFRILPKTFLAIIILSLTVLYGVNSAFVSSLNKQSQINAVTQPEAGLDGAKITFSFDDGYASTLDKAAPILNGYGFAGTVYVTTDYLGQREFLDWNDVEDLQNEYGWEIGGHSMSHANLAEINSEQLNDEIIDNYQSLIDNGINPTTFATPFGSYTGETINTIASTFKAHRTFHDNGYNQWPYSTYQLKVQQVQVGVDLDKIKSYINEAKATNTWLILVFHDIADTPKTSASSYQFSTDDLAKVAKYVHDSGLPVTTIANGIDDTDKNNLLHDGSFKNGIPDGWNLTKGVRADSYNNGSTPDSKNSIRIKSNATTDADLVSPLVTVDPKSTYLFSSYVSLEAESGIISIYVDEYDSNKNWIRGSFITDTDYIFYKSVSTQYAVGSDDIAYIRIQFIAPSDSSTTAYIDQVYFGLK